MLQAYILLNDSVKSNAGAPFGSRVWWRLHVYESKMSSFCFGTILRAKQVERTCVWAVSNIFSRRDKRGSARENRSILPSTLFISLAVLFTMSSISFFCWIFSSSRFFTASDKSRISAWQSATDSDIFWFTSWTLWNLCRRSFMVSSCFFISMSEVHVISKWSSTLASMWSLRWALLS